MTIRAILTDVEGTTTPISFVHDVLFPYAEERLEEACARAAGEPAVREAVTRLRAEHQRETAGEPPAFGEGALYARWLMDRDRKSTGLKMLQGLIWEHGYRDATLRAQVFPDVAAALRRWHQAGLRLRVYSSGSVLAQKLLFAHTEDGDLTPYFEGYHDTTTGPKMEPDSYRKIAADCRLQAEEILFLSDVGAELDAANVAGMRIGLLTRPGNKPVESLVSYPAYRDFDELSTVLRL